MSRCTLSPTIAHSFSDRARGNINGGYEYSSRDLQGDDDRIFAQAGITARF